MSLSMSTSGGLKAFSRSTVQLYRDCLRLARHIGGRSTRGDMLRKMVRSEFKKNLKVEDPAAIEALKSNAVRGLANYLMIESTSRDARLQQFANTYAQKELKQATEAMKEGSRHISDKPGDKSS